jgi:hypothetical protein
MTSREWSPGSIDRTDFKFRTGAHLSLVLSLSLSILFLSQSLCYCYDSECFYFHLDPFIFTRVEEEQTSAPSNTMAPLQKFSLHRSISHNKLRVNLHNVSNDVRNEFPNFRLDLKFREPRIRASIATSESYDTRGADKC